MAPGSRNSARATAPFSFMIHFEQRGETLWIVGDLERADAAVLETALPPLLAVVTELDCSGLDIEDGAALAVLARVLKDAAASRSITVRSAPQLLAHTLYRVNALARFQWPDLRWDEAST